MRRRTFLRGVTSAGLAAAIPLPTAAIAQRKGPRAAVDRIVVIGAGIVGASIAFNLAKRGADVVLLDKTGPASQASGNSFAWINASWYDQPDSYFNLRTHSLNEYHRLSTDAGFTVHWGGSLEWYHTREEQDEMAQGVSRIQALGAPTWMIERERIADIEPVLNPNWDGRLAWCSRDGAVDPAVATHALVGGVVRHGGSAIFPAAVRSIRASATEVSVETDADSFTADLIVIAAGIHANEVAAMAGVETTLLRPPTPGIIVTTRPMERWLNAVSYTTDCHFHQLPDGRVVVGEKTGAPNTAEHLAHIATRPNAYPGAELAAQHAARVIATAGRYVSGLDPAEAERIGIGWRPLPVDGLPILGHVPATPRVYVAAMHSGVTLAPIVGHLAAMEILDRVRVDLLADFRIERL